MDGYLYFHDEDIRRNDLLLVSILHVSLVFDKVYIAVTKQTRSWLLPLLPSNCLIDVLPESIDDDPTVKKLFDVFKSGKAKCNHWPIDKHCFYRWIWLKKQNMYGQPNIFNLDWDTLVYPSFKTFIDKIENNQTHLAGPALYITACHPIWTICPNILYISNKALVMYIESLDIFINSIFSQSFALKDLFQDMAPWSRVASLLLRYDAQSVINFDDIDTDSYVCHNFRVINDCGINFMPRKYYYAENQPRFTKENYLEAKALIYSPEGSPYFALDSNHTGLSWLKKAAAIHFSGVESKHIFMNVFMNDVKRYLSWQGLL